MDEMTQYVVSNLQAAENNIKTITKALKRQKRLNACLFVLALGCFARVSKLENQRDDNKKQIDEIKNEIVGLKVKLALKTAKGEAKM